MISLNTEEINNYIAGADAMKSHAVIEGGLMTVRKELARFGIEKADVEIYPSANNVTIAVYNYNTDYEAIMNDKNTYIGDTETITCNYGKKITLVGREINMNIRFHFSCSLPEEDLMTLRMLGKVKTEHHSNSYTSENIICEI